MKLTKSQRRRLAQLERRVARAELAEARAGDAERRAIDRRADADEALWQFKRDHGLLEEPKPGSTQAVVASIFKKLYSEPRVAAKQPMLSGSAGIEYSIEPKSYVPCGHDPDEPGGSLGIAFRSLRGGE